MATKNILVELSFCDVCSSIYLEEEAIIYRPGECILTIMEEAKKLADGPAQVFTTFEEGSRFLSSTNLQQFYNVARESGSDNILVMMSLEVLTVDVVDLTLEDEINEEFTSVEERITKSDKFEDAPSFPATPHDIDLLWPALDSEKSETIMSDDMVVSDCQSNLVVSECSQSESWECVDENDVPARERDHGSPDATAPVENVAQERTEETVSESEFAQVDDFAQERTEETVSESEFAPVENVAQEQTKETVSESEFAQVDDFAQERTEDAARKGSTEEAEFDVAQFALEEVEGGTREKIEECVQVETEGMQKEVNDPMQGGSMDHEELNESVQEAAIDESVQKAAIDESVQKAAIDETVREAAIDESAQEAAIDESVQKAAIDESVQLAAIDDSVQEEPAIVEPQPVPRAPDPMETIVDHILAVITAHLFGADIQIVLPILAQKMLDFLASHGIDCAPDSLLRVRDGDVSDIRKCAFECVVYCSTLAHSFRLELIMMLQTAAVQMVHQTPTTVEVHPDTICDGCEITPLIGKRFKSLRMDDYDLCEKCMEGRNPSYYQQIPGQVSARHSNSAHAGEVRDPSVHTFTHSHAGHSHAGHCHGGHSHAGHSHADHSHTVHTVTHTDNHTGQTHTVTHTNSQCPPTEHAGTCGSNAPSEHAGTCGSNAPSKRGEGDILFDLTHGGISPEFVVPILAHDIIRLSELFGLTHIIPESLLQVTRGEFHQIQQATRDTVQAINELDEVTRESFVANLHAVLEESIAQEMAWMHSPESKTLPSPVVLSCDCINSSMDPGDLDGDMVSFAKDEFKLSGAFLVGQFNSASIANVTFVNPSGEPIENAALRLCFGDGMGYSGMDFGTIAPHEVFEVVMDFSFRPDEPKGMSCWAFTAGDTPIGSLIVADTV